MRRGELSDDKTQALTLWLWLASGDEFTVSPGEDVHCWG
jgi:hypothetical protein